MTPRSTPGRTRDFHEPPGIVDWRGEYRTYMERPITKIEPLIFDNTLNNANWEEWKQNFVAIVGSKHMGDETKIVQLFQMIRGEPSRLIASYKKLPYSTRNYRLMWNELETNYGGINRQRNTLYQRIKQFPIIKKFDKENTML